MGCLQSPDAQTCRASPRAAGWRCSSSGAEAVGHGEAEWEASKKFGKSTVTQELWRRREADRLGIGGTQAISYRFSTSHPLRDEYVGNTEKALVGKLLEDFDALAGNIAFDWCSDLRDSTGKPPLLVTAAVDRIKFSRRVEITEDVFLTGSVIYTGGSSMLVRMVMNTGRRPGTGEQISVAYFVYVAVDRATHKAVKIHELTPENPEEKELFELGAKKAAEQKARRQNPYASAPKDVATISAMLSEGDILTELPGARRLMEKSKVLISRTMLENTVLTKPQDLNTAGNVFGGYLMRNCYELAYCTAFAFAGRWPKFREICEFVFAKPVPQGSVLRLKAKVIYTVGQDACVEVAVIVIQPERQNTFRANKILVVFELEGDVPDVVPNTEAEAQGYFKAKAQYESGYS